MQKREKDVALQGSRFPPCPYQGFFALESRAAPRGLQLLLFNLLIPFQQNETSAPDFVKFVIGFTRFLRFRPIFNFPLMARHICFFFRPNLSVHTNSLLLQERNYLFINDY